jgi:hypothetical protein
LLLLLHSISFNLRPTFHASIGRCWHASAIRRCRDLLPCTTRKLNSWWLIREIRLNCGLCGHI